MFGIEDLVLKSLHFIAQESPYLFGLGAYLLILIAIGGVVLYLVIIVCSVWIPCRIFINILNYFRGRHETLN
jgi:hypothetical protein